VTTAPTEAAEVDRAVSRTRSDRRAASTIGHDVDGVAELVAECLILGTPMRIPRGVSGFNEQKKV
jgi:hypothetical protein